MANLVGDNWSPQHLISTVVLRFVDEILSKPSHELLYDSTPDEFGDPPLASPEQVFPRITISEVGLQTFGDQKSCEEAVQRSPTSPVSLNEAFTALG